MICDCTFCTDSVTTDIDTVHTVVLKNWLFNEGCVDIKMREGVGGLPFLSFQ